MQSPLFENKEERTDAIIAFVVLLAFGTFLGYTLWGNNATADIELSEILGAQSIDDAASEFVAFSPDDETIEVKDKNDNEDEKVIAATEEIAPVTVDTLDHHLNKDDKNDLPELPDSTITISNDTTTTTGVSSASDLVDVVTEKVEDLKEEVSDITDKATTEIKTIVPTTPAPIAETTEIAKVKKTVENRCRIIVGSYRLKSSMTKMLNQLIEADYDAISYREKGLNVVTIRHTCDQEALDTTVEEVRKNFAKGAFVSRR